MLRMSTKGVLRGVLADRFQRLDSGALGDGLRSPTSGPCQLLDVFEVL